jgi:Flp pilus assembly protein TadG
MKLRSTHGQATVLTVVFLTVLVGMAALVLDVGSWYRAKRDAQSTADAAALAGAQGLPDTTNAQGLAQQYASKNGGLGTGTVTFPPKGITPNDTITVTVKRTAPTFFSKLFGKNSVSVGATATVTSEPVSQARYVAPITVYYKHPLLNCKNGNPISCNPIYGAQTTIPLEDIHQSGSGNASAAFGLINLNQNSGGNIGANVLADWLTNGYPDYLGLGSYNSAPSANFNNSQFLAALNSVLGKEVLFPVYRIIRGPGSNALYDIIGWVGFVITSYDTGGSAGTITGHFTRYIADGVQVTSCGCTDLGVHKIQLVN